MDFILLPIEESDLPQYKSDILYCTRVPVHLCCQYTTTEQNHPKFQYDMNTRAAVSVNGDGRFSCTIEIEAGIHLAAGVTQR